MLEKGRHASLLDEEIRRVEFLNELRVARLALLVAGMALLVSLWVVFFFKITLGLILAGICVILGAHYGLVVPRLIRPGLRLSVLRVVNVTVEVSAPAVATLVDIHMQGAAYALTSTPPLLTFASVIASGLRINRGLSLYAGVLGAAEYLCLYAHGGPDLSPGLLAQFPTLSLGFAMQHAVYILTAGFVAAVVAHVGLSTTRRVALQLIEKERVLDIFGDYVSHEALDRVLAGRLALEGERRTVTVLFADIRGFTTLASGHSPETVVFFLNNYFSRVCEVIAHRGGMVNKFMGDGLLAVFGAPQEDPDHARNACLAALDMVKAAAGITRPDGTPARIGVGVHTGELVLGSIGSARRKDYTVIGDTVNVASRIEGLTRKYEGDVLISEAARTAAGDVLTAEIGPVTVKGRADPVVVHRLLEVAAKMENIEP